MKAFLLTLLLIVICYFIFVTFTKILERVYNIMSLLSSNKSPKIAKQTHTNGMVLNKKTRKLEADQSQITPF
jgi:hypothetical protein